MRISVFGLGYVGTVASGCLAREGHEVIGVDVSRNKVDLINAGQPPIIEAEIGDIIRDAVSQGRLRAVQNAEEAILGSGISFICVGTPSLPNGSLDLSHVENVSRQIGAALKGKDQFHTVVVRSTMLPGSTRHVVAPALEKFSGKKAGQDFGLCYNPEFMREGSSVHDFYNPPKTVIGADDEKSSGALKDICENLPGEMVVTSIEAAEMVKYVDNNFHAVKITFANEIGMICSRLGIDSHVVMDIFCKDTKLNISRAYLKPGFAFGGSCLPKDVRALSHKAKMMDIEVPLLSSLLLSNQQQVKQVVERIIRMEKKKIGFLGISFKEGTDDLRESPLVEVVETLLGKGYAIMLYDKNVSVARLVGANKRYIEERIPHIAQLLCEDIDSVIRESEIIVIGNKSPEFEKITDKIKGDQIVLDLVRADRKMESKGNYHGLSW